LATERLKPNAQVEGTFCPGSIPYGLKTARHFRSPQQVFNFPRSTVHETWGRRGKNGFGVKWAIARRTGTTQQTEQALFPPRHAPAFLRKNILSRTGTRSIREKLQTHKDLTPIGLGTGGAGERQSPDGYCIQAAWFDL